MDEEEVEDGDGEDHRQDRGAAAEPGGRDHDAEEEDHRQVRRFHAPEQEGADAAAERHDDEAPEIGDDGGGSVCGMAAEEKSLPVSSPEMT